jgi:hypothetical protein
MTRAIIAALTLLLTFSTSAVASPEALSRTFHEYPSLAECETNARVTNDGMELMGAGMGLSKFQTYYHGDGLTYFTSQLFYVELGQLFVATIVCKGDGTSETTIIAVE